MKRNSLITLNEVHKRGGPYNPYWIKRGKDGDLVYLFHGTGSELDLEEVRTLDKVSKLTKEIRYKALAKDDDLGVDKWWDCKGGIGPHQYIDSIPCTNGFTCSSTLFDAFIWNLSPILAMVQVSGDHVEEKGWVREDKDLGQHFYSQLEYWRELKVVKKWRWTKKDSIKLISFLSKNGLLYGEDKDDFDYVFSEVNKSARDAIDVAKYSLERVAEFDDTDRNRKKLEKWFDKYFNRV